MMGSSLPRRLALVVPDLMGAGGVPAVARFIRDTALRTEHYDLRLVSLSSASNDRDSVRIVSPSSWFHGARTTTTFWEGQSVAHVGAVGGEFEFQRYKPRAALTQVVADCDVIQVVCGSAAWANSVIGLGKPVSVQVATRACVERRLRDASPRSLSSWWRKGMTKITNRLDDRALRHADAVQVENPWMFDYTQVLNSGRDIDIRYAPPGVDANVYCPGERRELTLDAYVLCVARLDDARKNVGLLLEAFAKLPHSLRIDVRLVLAGAVGPPSSFWQRADELGLRDRVSYVERPDSAALLRLYQGASVFALPSDEEGLGMVLLEAMACGVPVVSTRSGGPDGIITDGEDGYLTALDNADAMSLRLGQLLHDANLNERMGRAARKTIEKRYDERVAGEAFVEVWDRLAHKSRGSICAA